MAETVKPLQLAHPPGAVIPPDSDGSMTNDAILRNYYSALRAQQYLVDTGQMDTMEPKGKSEPASPAPKSTDNPESGRPAEDQAGDPMGAMVMQAMEGLHWPVQEMQNWDGKTRASFTQILDTIGRVMGITLPKGLPK